MLQEILFLIDIKRIVLAEMLGFFRSFQAKNPHLENLFQLDNKNTEKNLLIVSLTSLNYTINIESLFAKYFNLKGYKVFFLTNFREQKAVKTFRFIKGKIIYHHFVYLKKALSFLFKKMPQVQDSASLKNFSYGGINIGTAVYSSASRKLKAGNLDFSDKKTKRLANRYLLRSIIYLEAAKEILEKVKPELLLVLEKGYIANSEIANLAVEKGIGLIHWEGCQDPDGLVFTRYDKSNQKDYPFSLSSETWQAALKKPWQEKYGAEALEIFKQGYLSRDWFRYYDMVDNIKLISREELVKKYGLDPNKKIAVLFAHILWDANLFYGKDLFEQGFEEWLIESAKAMVKNPKLNWLLKIHPANRLKHTQEKIKVEYREISALKKTFGKIPETIKIIYPEDNINPYGLYQVIDFGITVRGTVGVELPCFGVPVLTAGTGRYSDKGFTIDSSSTQEYLNKLACLQEFPKVSEQQKRLALLYSYYLFKLRPLKLSSIKEKSAGLDMDIEIKIKTPQEGKDLSRFVDWAVNSKRKDFLNENL